jgi:hypothetical protein
VGRYKNSADTRAKSLISIANGGGFLEMQKETIIYFEHLGFGWVLDYAMLKEIKLTKLRDEFITDTSLMKIIENMLTDNPNA